MVMLRPPPGYNDGCLLSAMPTFTSTMRSSSPKVLPMPSTSSAAKCSTSMIVSSVPMMGKTIPLYDANRSLPRSWTKVMHAGVLGRLSWGGSSTPCKEPSNSPPHRRDHLNVLLQTALTRKRITMKEWRRILGELRSMVLGIPSGRGYSPNSGLFSRGPRTTVYVSTRKLNTSSSICSSSPTI